MKTILDLYNNNQLPYCYLLLDAAKNYRNFKHEKVLGSKQGYENLFAGTIDKSAPFYLSPLLIPLNISNINQLNECIERCKDVAICSNVLYSYQPMEVISSHLRNYLSVMLPNGQEALFRFYDPTVAKRLPFLMNQEDYQSFIQPFEMWWYADSDYLFKPLPKILEGF